MFQPVQRQFTIDARDDSCSSTEIILGRDFFEVGEKFKAYIKVDNRSSKKEVLCLQVAIKCVI